MENNSDHSSRKFWITGLLTLGVAGLILGGIWLIQNRLPATTNRQDIPIGESITEPNPEGEVPSMSDAIQPVSFRLSAGQAQPQAASELPIVSGEPLSDEDIDQIVARLPGLASGETDQVEFKLAQDPIPPPRPGETISQPFPPLESAAQPDLGEAGALKVLRFAPQGEIDIAPFISITFNQPMVPLGTLGDLAAQDVPLQIEPALNGTWRWLGTRTLTFETDSELIDRLPKATIYQVLLPAGTKSATGGVLEQDVAWSFSTPPIKLVDSYPQGEGQARQPTFYMAFDQRIDPAAVLASVQVKAAGKLVTVKLISPSELEQEKGLSARARQAGESRWLAFRTQEPLPADSDILVTLGSGAPSAEGPLTTSSDQSYSFRTYAPLRILDHGCAWGGDSCPPLTPFYINLNNPIDPALYQDSWVTITPELPGARVDVLGSRLQIRGASKGQTTYTVVINAQVQDIYGQKLGKDEKLTFKVGPAEARLSGPDSSFVTLDPSQKKPLLSVYTINFNKLGVKIYSVTPGDFAAFNKFLRERNWENKKRTPPGKLVVDENLPIEAAADSLTQVDIDLSRALTKETGAGLPSGHAIVVIEPPLKNQNDRYWQTTFTWVQVTQIGLDAITDPGEMVAWTTALADGKALEGIKLQIGNNSGVQSEVLSETGKDGLARFPIQDGALYLVASQGDDQAILGRSEYYWDEYGWTRRTLEDQLRWYVFDDRQMYRPGEEVHLKGWLRRVGGQQMGDVGLPGNGLSGVSYLLLDPQGNELERGQVDVNDLGGFDFMIKLPEAMNLGAASLELTTLGSLGKIAESNYYHTFQVQEFRTPEFEVTARNETPGPYYQGGYAVTAVEAKYYAGDPLPNAEVSWLVRTSPGSYSPPNWPDFTFGTWQPWWYSYRGGRSDEFGSASSETKVETFTGQTDAAGAHYLRLDFDSTGGATPLSIQAEATVMDVNRQAWTSSTNLLVHPAALYIGLRSEKMFVARGTPIRVDLIVTDLDGKAVEDRPMLVEAARMEWQFQGSTWVEEAVDVQVCKLGSALEPVSCTFETPLGGEYRITATVTDAENRSNQSQIRRWVSGGQLPPERKVELEQVTLIPDLESYQPGDTAQVLVQAPFSPAEGLLTVSRSGLLYTERFQLVEGAATLQIPIKDEYIPNLNIQVDLVGSAERTDERGAAIKDAPRRPAYASGQLSLSIPPRSRTLALAITPAESELEPGGETQLSITVEDARGEPVGGAELAVVVVDEAILALTGYQPADPLSIFYSERASELESRYGRSSILLADPQSLVNQESQEGRVLATAEVGVEQIVELPASGAVYEEAAMAPTAKGARDAAETGQSSEPIRVRSDFNPLALFAAQARSGANGEAIVAVKLPDNLTRYRVIAVAVDNAKQFGLAESNLVARLPVMVRPSAPRFLNFGDRFELPVVVQNQTGEERVVDIVLRTTNLALLDAEGQPLVDPGTAQGWLAGRRIVVPAHDRVEVRFPARSELAGTARLQIAVVSGSFADASTLELPVYTPATTEAFATYGVLDEGAVAQPLMTPSTSGENGVYAQYGGLEIQTSSTALQALTDAVIYLVKYPYECSEQLASRILGIAALRDVLTAFEAEDLPAPQELEAVVGRDLERLKGMQNDDGGFPYWRRGYESVPFNTLHVAHALARAEQKGFEVPGEMRPRALEYLRQIENHYPDWYSADIRRSLSAYALYVRNLMGDRDAAKARKLFNDAGLEKLSLDAVGWLWTVLQDSAGSDAELQAIRQYLGNRVVETANSANFTDSYSDQNYLLLGSDRRSDAILLEALIGDSPQSDLIPKLVNGLLAHRIQGRWGNTQENVFVLIALDRYFNTYEAQTPDFVARIWLGDGYLGSNEFRGRTTQRLETKVPMGYLVSQSGASQDLVLSKDGAGRLYYRLGLRYAPSNLELGPLEMGFSVQRRYEGVDHAEDVYQDEQGAWHIQAGARVRVRLTLVADNRRYHVALADPLPAGLEIVNPLLAVSGSTPEDPSQNQPKYGWWWWPWFEHQNLRDERAEAFTSLLWEGVYEYTYIARATTPGTFIVPPAKAEEMYSPEVFGRSGSDVVIVE